MKQTSADTRRTSAESKSKSSLFEKEPIRPTTKLSDRTNSSTIRSDHSSTHKPIQSSSMSSPSASRNHSAVPSSSNRSRDVSVSGATDRHSSSMRDEYNRSSHHADRRRSPSRHRSSHHSRSPSPRGSYARDSSTRRDSRSPPRQPTQPMRFGRVEKIRPEETQSNQIKRPYDSRYDVWFL